MSAEKTSLEKLSSNRPEPSPLQTQPSPVVLSNEVDLIDGVNARLKWTNKVENIVAEDNVTEYEVNWWSDETDKRTARTRSCEYLVTKLNTGQKYCAHVLACKIGNIPEPKPSNTVIFDTAPMKPLDLRVQNYERSPHDSIKVTFKNENTKEVDHEVVVRKLIEGEDIRHRTNGMQSFVVSNLDPGESYSVYVRTTYRDSEKWSLKTFYDGTIETYPAIPQNVELVYENAEMCLTWNPLDIKPACYKVFYETNYGQEEIKDTSDAFFRLSTLTPATTYRFRVAAVNKAGVSEKSEEKEKITVPSAPFNIQVTPNRLAPETSFVVKYEDVDKCKKLYEIIATGIDGKVVAKVTTEGQRVEINKLKAGQSYFIQVTSIYCNQRSEPAYYMR